MMSWKLLQFGTEPEHVHIQTVSVANLPIPERIRSVMNIRVYDTFRHLIDERSNITIRWKRQPDGVLTTRNITRLSDEVR